MGTTLCERCGTGEGTSEVLVDGTRRGRRERWCTDCWNTQARGQQEAHAKALAERERCEACGTRAATWKVGVERVDMCGWCKTKAERGAQRAVRSGGAGAIMVSMFGGNTAGRGDLISFARGQALCGRGER